MSNQSKNLYTKGQINNVGQLRGKWNVKKNNTLIDICLYDKGIYQYNQKNQHINTIQFDFDLKFSFTKSQQPKNSIKFERGKQSIVYSLASQLQVQAWRQILKKKINQRGFHQQFKPIKKIGKGNFASVYLAQKHQDGISYAVKAFSKQAAYSQQNGKQCLIKQIEVMRALNNNNCMKLYEVFESENSLYIIFQLLSGGQLYDKVKSKYKFKPNQTKQIVYGILKGLKQMHAKGIMHRDLKPQNLLFRKQGQWDCVIADFGLAQFTDIQTYLFVRCGTPGYVAPQVINIKDMKTKYSPICDIYSLGLIFHILLFGKSAFPGTTYNQVLSQNRAANIDLTGQQYKKAGQQALDLLNKMLKKKPTERITAQQCLKHQYFNFENQMIDQNQNYQLKKSIRQSGVDSPLLTSSNSNRKQDKNIKKDSCVDFKMGKQNVMTGRTDQVNQQSNQKLSIVNVSSPNKKAVKVSRFVGENQNQR